MITPAYAPTATERVLPRLALDFTTAVADPRVATTRAANTATRFNQNGLIEIVNANLPRFDFSPTALTCQGQLIEETRTNLFLNSLIDGTNLSTQSVTLSAVAYTLSFYGSGSVAISGGHSATVSGVGDFPNRKTYTFTPTAGSSTFTVSGDVKFAQLEIGAFATSYIPTTTTSLTRNADVVSMTGTNFSDWYNASEGTFVASGQTNAVPAAGAARTLMAGGSANNLFLLSLLNNNTTQMYNTLVMSGVVRGDFRPSPIGQNAIHRASFAYKNGVSANSAMDGAASTPLNTSAPIADVTLDALYLGNRPSGNFYLNGCLTKILYYPLQLTAAETTAFSKQ